LNKIAAQTQVSEVVSRVSGVPTPEIHNESRLRDDLALDSMQLFDLQIELEEVFQVELPESAGKLIISVGDIVQLMEELRS